MSGARLLLPYLLSLCGQGVANVTTYPVLSPMKFWRKKNSGTGEQNCTKTVTSSTGLIWPGRRWLLQTQESNFSPTQSGKLIEYLSASQLLKKDWTPQMNGALSPKPRSIGLYSFRNIPHQMSAQFYTSAVFGQNPIRAVLASKSSMLRWAVHTASISNIRNVYIV